MFNLQWKEASKPAVIGSSFYGPVILGFSVMHFFNRSFIFVFQFYRSLLFSETLIDLKYINCRSRLMSTGKETRL